VIVMNHQKITI